MEKLLYILMFIPFGMFGQIDDPCYSINNIYADVVNQNPPLSIDLSSGWNLIGYPCSESIDAAEAFSSIVGDIEIVKNNAADVYWPEFDFNGIGQLETLEGYQIKLNNLVVDFSFCSPIYLPDYPGCTDCGSLNFNPLATLDDGSCNYDSDGDGIYDADEVVGCLDLLACNYGNVIGATDNGGCIFPEEGYNCLGLEQNISIGDTAFGGIIFYIDYTGEHGLVAAHEDLDDKYEWGCYLTEIDGADSTAIGSGYQNTLDIVAGCPDTQIAASEALAFESGGYDDWYLPSSGELYEMFLMVDIVDFNGHHLSSSENGLLTALGLRFDTGAINPLSKSTLISVRPIRSF